jgi:hypothetical protein
MADTEGPIGSGGTFVRKPAVETNCSMTLLIKTYPGPIWSPRSARDGSG